MRRMEPTALYCSRAVALMSLEPVDLELGDDLEGVPAEELDSLTEIFEETYLRNYRGSKLATVVRVVAHPPPTAFMLHHEI